MAPAPDAAPVLHGRIVTLRPVAEADVPTLLAILEEPQVAHWWRRTEWERVVVQGASTFTITVAGGGGSRATGQEGYAASQAVAGCIQYTEETDPDYMSAAVDIFVGTAAQGRGIGEDAMRALITWLIGARGHHRLTVDPAADNARAIHVYRKLGFRPVGILRRYERVDDGVWRDALLMELLADDLAG